MTLEVAEHILQRLLADHREGWPELGRPVFLVDGTSVQLAHEPKLVKAFPPGRNQHGEHHWPVLKMVVFHDVYSGLALQPVWGPMFGSKAVSEQALAKDGLSRLPADAVVMADCNFGIFDYAYAVHTSRRGVIVRLTKERALRILGKQPYSEGAAVAVSWKPSGYERSQHPDLPPEAQLQGRIVIFRHPGRPSELIYVFTTVETLDHAAVKELYRRRWYVETDLRSLKRHLELHRISGRSVDVVEKELIVAMVTYNLVRAVMCAAAERAHLEPRRLSFAGAAAVVDAGLKHLVEIEDEQERQKCLERMLENAARLKLPNRSRPRSYPRQVWGTGGTFPPRKRTGAEEEKP